MKKLFAALLLVLWAGLAQAATLLPNGQQTFFLANGAPAAGGFVYTYIPNTTSPKTTWKDAGQTIQNTNPILLDASGSAVIYGSGSYRELVYDASGNLIFDRVTSDTTATTSSTFVGIVGGTANALAVSASNFSATSGQTISFFAVSANTGAATIAVNGNTYNIYKDAATGPVALTGGELTVNGVTTLWFDSALNAFHLEVTNTVGGPFPGEIRMFAMSTCPTRWQETNGLAISRTGNPGLFAAVGTTWGTGDGSTTFNVPNLSGTVPRAWDHGRGLDPAAPAFAAYEADQYGSHTHPLSDPTHAHTSYAPISTVILTYTIGVSFNAGAYSQPLGTTASATGITISASGSAETRAKSTIVLFCVKL